jgi:6-phosphogluconate dehydrogenase
VIAYDIDPHRVAEAARLGAEPANSLESLAGRLQPPRVIWLMVPAGEPVDSVISGLESHIGEGDTIIDGGNSFYKDSVRRAKWLGLRGIHFLYVGTSGGLEGAEKGASLTVGGSGKAYATAEPLLRAIARPGALLHCGPSGAGHYVKMVHNRVEYTMLQALGEGFEMLELGSYDLDLEAIAEVWNNGCVIRSWMLELLARALSADLHLDKISGEVGGGETERWMVETAMELGIPTPTTALSLLMRLRSRQGDTFAGKVVAAVRREFGGHVVKEAP